MILENSEILNLPFVALYNYYLSQGGKEETNFSRIKLGVDIKLHISHFLKEFATERFIANGKSDEIYDRVSKETYTTELLNDEEETRKMLILDFLLTEDNPISSSYEVTQ